MPNVPFPEYAITNANKKRLWHLATYERRLATLRREWAGDGATELVAETLRMAIEIDQLYADYCAKSETDSTDEDTARFSAVEDAFSLPGMGSEYGMALDVSSHLEWIDTDERERFAQYQDCMQPSEGRTARHIEVVQTEWLTTLRDAFKAILAPFPVQVAQPVEVAS